MPLHQFDEEAVFGVASSLEAGDARESYLKQVCSDDTTLLVRMQTLLQIHDQEKEFLEVLPIASGDTVSLGHITGRQDGVLGQYELRHEIGEGSYGIVFLAEQLEPFRRTVAIKIIKPGMDSREVVSRFMAERQTLAMMQHPNIATVLDAGTTDNGRPYFVMEWIQGDRISDFCDRENLTLVERIHLFQTVCEAVQHAHEKGVIHRDLKPSNILVTVLAGKPIVKVIDFGIAKALNSELTERSFRTSYRQFVGTPQYMSPEQTQLEGKDVDARSDVYALGVLLYELVCGQAPYSGENLRRVGFDEMRRIICEDDPPRPSTRLRTLKKEAALQVASQRRCEPSQLHNSLCGGLDSVVMRALEKNPDRRYDTPRSLARDLERHLNCEPVDARPPSRAYRIQKMARKHPGAVAAMLATLSLFLVLVVVAVLFPVLGKGGTSSSGNETNGDVATLPLPGENASDGKMQQLLADDRARDAASVAWKHSGKVRLCWAAFRYGDALAHIYTALDLLGDDEPELYEQKRVLEPVYWMLAMTLRMLGEQEQSLAAMWKWVKVDNYRSAHELWWATQLYLEDDGEAALELFQQSKVDLLLTHLDLSKAAFTHYGQRCEHTMAVTYLCAQSELSVDPVHRQQLLERAIGYSQHAMSSNGSLGLIHEVVGEFEQAASCFEADLDARLENLNSIPTNSPVQVFFVQDALFHFHRAISEVHDPYRQEAAFQKTLATYDEKLPSWHPVGALLRMEYSDFLVEQGRPVEAEEVIFQACEMLGGYTLASREALGSAGNRWIELLEKNGKANEVPWARDRLHAALARRQNGR